MSARTRARSGFSVEERRRILADHAVVQAALEELGHLAVGGDVAFRNRLGVHEELYARHAVDLRRRYERGLPVVALSRCPLTEQPVHHSIDHHGLDGLWWDYQAAVRPVETVPETFVGLTGALRLGGPLEHTPFLVKPGPAAPFVIPRLLEAGAVAVLSQIEVGAHTGFAITYFAQAALRVEGFNEWGRNDYRRFEGGAAVGWGEAEDPGAMDFDLAPWIEREKVVWTEPGDAALTLRGGTDECPYLDLPGPRERQRFQYGAAWHASVT